MHSWTPARLLATPDALLHGRADPCTYVISASLLPNELHHGIDLTARIKPAWPVVPGQPSPRHYYRMSLGPYDTLQATRAPPLLRTRVVPGVGDGVLGPGDT